MRKIFHPPIASLEFTRRDGFVGHNDNLPLPKPLVTPPNRVDAAGNILPNRIRRYSFADEYSYRI